MNIPYSLTITRLLALVGLGFSGVLLVYYLEPTPTICGFDSGCEQVVLSEFGQVLGVPLPWFGILAFGTILALSLWSAGWANRLLRFLAQGMGLAGLGLFLVQALALQQFCPYCLVIDASAVGLAVIELVGDRKRLSSPAGGKAKWVWLTLAVTAIVAGLGWGLRRPNVPIPEEIASLWVSDKVTVVEIADFQCPHCRYMHQVLLKVLRERRGDPVHFVLVPGPMPGHPEARDAARAFLCAKEQGKGDEMAEALFQSFSLTVAACEQRAVALGLSLPEFQSCVANPNVDRVLDANLAWIKPSTPKGLPAIWVQDQLFSGVKSVEEMEEALQMAEWRLQRSLNAAEKKSR